MKTKMEANINYRLILTVCGILILSSCAQEREKKIIDDYHSKTIKMKGKKALFVSKETVENFMLKRYIEVNIDDIRIGDNISFFDENGNIFYQVNCIDIKNDVVYIKCLNLSSAEYYRTSFNINNIIDLKGKNIAFIKVFRKN